MTPPTSLTLLNEQFGQAVALSGDGAVLAVGAPGEDGSTPGINGDESPVPRTLPRAVFSTDAAG